MPLINSQYDEIRRSYDARQLRNQRILEARTKEAYEKLPRLKEIDDAIASCSIAQARRLLDGDPAALASLHEQLGAYRREKAALLKANGYPDDYFTPAYTCPDCKDTGYIGSKRCHCLEQAAIDLVYTQSNLREILKTENFGTFSFDYYSDNDVQPSDRSFFPADGAGRRCKMPPILSHILAIPFPISIFMGIRGSEKRFYQTALPKN